MDSHSTLTLNRGGWLNHYPWLEDMLGGNLKKVTLYPALELYFKAGGASVSFDAGPGELTFARLGLFDDKIW